MEAEKGENEAKKLQPESLAGDIVFKDVSFRYGTRQPVLEDINLTIKKGQKVAFVGESGSGKTTLSKLLLHLYTAESGNILINNNNIEDIQIEKMREKIAYISQETSCPYQKGTDSRPSALHSADNPLPYRNT